MGAPPSRPPGTHTETRYFIDANGNVFQRPVQVENPQAAAPAPAPEYKYYRKPDGTVVRQRVDAGPARAAAAPAAAAAAPRTRAAPPAPRPTRPQQVRRSRDPIWTTKRWAKHVVVIVIVTILLLVPTTLPSLLGLWDTVTSGEGGFQAYPEVAEFTIVRQSSLTANAAAIQEYSINISKPFHIPGIHEVKGLSTSPNPTSTYTYKDQEWWYWSGSIPRGGTASITITYHMKLTSTLWDVDASDSGTIDDVPTDFQKYLGTEWKITPDDPEVQRLSQDIVGDERNVYRILRKIYDWLDDNLRYETQRKAEPKACNVTLADGNGDCDDQAILLASLARAAGVPVWLNLGIIYDQLRDYWGGHGWNNVFIPLKEGDHVIATVDVVNNQFLFRDPYHVSDYIDNGNGQDLQDYYTSWSYRYVGPNPQATSQETYDIKDIDTEGSVQYTGQRDINYLWVYLLGILLIVAVTIPWIRDSIRYRDRPSPG